MPVDFDEALDTELAIKRIGEGAHALLEAKSLYGRARILLSNYIKPLLLPLEEQEDGTFFYDGIDHVGGGSPEIKFKTESTSSD